MTMKLVMIIFILTICFSNCGQIKHENTNQERQTDNNEADTSNIVILPFDTTQYWMFKDNKPADLTTEDLSKLDFVLTKCVDDYNLDKKKKFREIAYKNPKYKLDIRDFFIDLTRYKRQYVATSNAKGEKEVWVNCFCYTSDTDWRTSLIVVDDGGNCYFNLKINLKTAKYFELMVNGIL